MRNFGIPAVALIVVVVVGVACFFIGQSGQKLVHADDQELATAKGEVEARAAKAIGGISNSWQKANKLAETQVDREANSYGGMETWMEEAETSGIEFALNEINGPLLRASSEFPAN